jgi:hypothetical protein
MRSVPIVVIAELGQHRPQVALIEHDEVIEAFHPKCPHEPLGDGVGGGRSLMEVRKRGLHILYVCA